MLSVMYVVKSGIRRPSTWVGSVVGISLAVMLIFGAFLSIDYVGIGVTGKIMDSVRVDMDVRMSVGDIVSNYDLYIEEIGGIEYVRNVDAILFQRSLLAVRYGDKSSANISPELANTTLCYSINPDSSLGVNIVEGKIGDGLAIGLKLSEYLGVHAGDKIVLYNPQLGTNISYEVSAILNFSDKFIDIIEWIYGEGSFFHEPGVVGEERYLPISLNPNYGLILSLDNYELLTNITAMIEAWTEFVDARLFIFVDRSAIVDPWDLERSARRIRDVEDRIYLTLKDLGNTQIYINDYLLHAVLRLNGAITGMKFIFTVIFMPIIFLGLLLAFITNWILVNKRRREIGLLMVRGLSRRQIFVGLLIEAIIVGIISGIIGLLLGFSFALYITDTYVVDRLGIARPGEIMPRLIYSYILPATIFGFALGLIAVLIPARTASKLSVDVAIREYVEEVEAEVKVTKKVFFLLVVSTYGIIELITGLPTLRLLAEAFRSVRVFVSVFLFLFLIFYFFSVFVGPFLFPYAFSKVIAGYSDRFRRMFNAITGIVSGEFREIATRNFIRKKTRMYKVIVLIGLTLSFGVFYMINNATITRRMRIEQEFRVGADVKVELSSVPYTLHNQLRDDLRKIEGVSELCFVAVAYGMEGTMDNRAYQTALIFIDKSYFNVAYIDDEYLEDTTMEEAAESINDNKSALLSIFAKRLMDVSKGDEVTFRYVAGGYVSLINFTVSGFIKFAPGILGLLPAQLNMFFFVGFDVVKRIPEIVSGLTISSILVDVEEGKNATEVGLKIKEYFDSIHLDSKVIVFDKAIREVDEDIGFLYMRLFTQIMFVVSIVISMAGLALTMISSLLERRREIALLRTRGASDRDLVGIVCGEVLIITVLGFMVGLTVAIAYSYGILVSTLTINYTISGIYVEYPPGYPITIPMELPIILISAFIVFIATGIAPLKVILKREISEELRIHH